MTLGEHILIKFPSMEKIVSDSHNHYFIVFLTVGPVISFNNLTANKTFTICKLTKYRGNGWYILCT